MLTPLKYIARGLRHYAPIHAATAVGVLAATAVITGALIVGDSVRGSLRDLAEGGLERIDGLLTAEIPFRAALIDAWRARCAAATPRAELTGMLFTRGGAVARSGPTTHRVSGLAVWGVPEEFAALAAKRVGRERQPWPPLQVDEAVLTANAARDLRVSVGDSIVVTLPIATRVPSDSLLGEKEEVAATRRLRVVAIVSAEDDAPFARLSLEPNQQAPRSAFVALRALQESMGAPQRLNAAAVSRRDAADTQPLDRDELAAVLAELRPALADFQLRLHPVPRAAPGQPPPLQLDSERLLLSPALVETAHRLWGPHPQGAQESVVYLANRLACGEREAVYSTVAGVDSTALLGPLRDEQGAALPLADDEVALNDWAAQRLGARVGDRVALHYYEPETTHGTLREAPPVELTVRAVVPLADADGKPTPAVDPALAPELPGVTDQQTINDWKLPFELVEEITADDEEYWEKYRTTPKAFVSLALAKRLWNTRWGAVTAVRVPLPEAAASADEAAGQLAAQLAEAIDPAQFGMRMRPLRAEAVRASTGTTPFEGLFLGFSFFLLASAVLLVALLSQLAVQQRAGEAGMLLAAGVAPRRLRGLFAGEGLLVALAGSCLGVLAGWGYAATMLHGLNTWWVEATATPFLRLHATNRSLLLGLAAGLGVSYLAIVGALRSLARLPIPQLLAGDVSGAAAPTAPSRWLTAAVPWGLAGAALAVGFAAGNLEGEAQAGAFLGSGGLALAGLLAATARWLRPTRLLPVRRWSLGRLALRTARRRPGRTLLSLGLAAAASFLIVGLGAFRLTPTDAGCGGFDLVATAEIPLQQTWETDEGRRNLGLGPAAASLLAGMETVACRVRGGEDASCLNLYQTRQPQILGVPRAMARRGRFAWAGGTTDDRGSPWDLLDAAPATDAAGRLVIPMVVDRNTAMYALKLYRPGDRLTVRDGQGGEAVLEVAALLQGSVLQGSLIVGEDNFLRLFPEESGTRFFLLRTGGGASERRRAEEQLESALEDFGFAAVDARQRLAELMAVQNTYLATFQTLGGLGLLLGAVGLGVAQLRSVLERRQELALLRAVGFSRGRLARLVLWENCAAIVGGAGMGCAAAAAATLPHALANQASPPWWTLGGLLAATALTGLATGALAIRAALRAPLWAVLRDA